MLVIPFLLVACDASHDVEWYKKHEKERKATIQECKKDADELQKPDCKKTRAKPNRQLFVFGKKDGEINSPKI
ncbi:EexN family lipoprotein [Escherichia coli]|uniref:EexN family lipoprotein n=1 Tax=Escherichia coli TaxID=562 RepID=UPI000DD496AC